MVRLVSALLPVLFGGSLLLAQQPAVAPPPARSDATLATQSFDRAKVAAAIHDSYYHPDKLAGLDCTVAFDWPAFFGVMKLDPASDRAKVIQELKIRSRAMRNKSAEFTFDWGDKTLDSREQLEGGIKQIIGGFYQMYWPMIAASPAGDAGDLTRIEPLADGGSTATFTDTGMTVTMTIDKDNVPTHYLLDGTLMKGTIDPHYVTSPNPVKGDLRRISELDVSEQLGTSTINVNVSLNYQAMDGYQVPKHVTFEIVGAYSIAMDFAACAVPKETSAP